MGENATEISERLSRIEQGVARIDERTERHDRDHSYHEVRIRALERDNDKRKGVMAALDERRAEYVQKRDAAALPTTKALYQAFIDAIDRIKEKLEVATE